MTSILTLHAAPAAGFDQPFEMLVACHQRVQRMLSLLERLSSHLGKTGNDSSAQQAARDVMRYFDVAGAAHHLDEEHHIFPTLRALGEPDLSSLVERLEQEHQAMTAQWNVIRADLLQIANGPLVVGSDEQMAARWATFASLYRNHIIAEETQAYPAARMHLDDLKQAEMGREMARRRGAK